ncbi:MAG: NAD-dependent epimerase/dehydratase family protein, partial [Amphiplicatus sp.]
MSDLRISAQPSICLVGAGAIAETHAAAIASLPGLAIGAVVDPNAEARARFAGQWPGHAAYAALDDALSAGGFTAAHVLTPPDRHADAAETLLTAGVPTLVEKPLAATSDDCARLVAAAQRSGARLGVNQNFIHHPAFARLRARLEAGEIGPLRHIACVYHAPLRQLAARQFGHWMFAAPVNLLLEQAVHPVSQARVLAGPLKAVAVQPGEIETLGDGSRLLSSLTAAVEGEKASVSFRFSVGESFPIWRLEAFGADGSLVADMYQNRCYSFGRTHWLEPVDQFFSAARTAGGIGAGALAGFTRYSLSQVRLAPRSDPFFVSMRASIEAFHASESPLETDGAFGAELVTFCETLAAAAMPASAPKRAPREAKAASYDVAVIGGTGFIGAYTVEALLKAGYSVGIMARSVSNPDPVFDDPKATLIKGDMRRREDVERAIGSARFVINLAHGGGGASYEEIREAMLGGAQTVAETCLEKRVERLVHVGSIASLYLGTEAGLVSDSAEPDAHAEERSDYARAKAETDRKLMEMRRVDALPVILLRPGLVVGAGASPFHRPRRLAAVPADAMLVVVEEAEAAVKRRS